MPDYVTLLPINSKIDIFVEFFHSAADIDSAIEDASFAFTLYDKSGVAVTGADGISIPHVGSEGPPDTRGNYRGTAIPTGLTIKEKYTGVLTCSNYKREWSEFFRVEKGQFNL